jgi:Holliday junction resolvase RusA-like endonuclease
MRTQLEWELFYANNGDIMPEHRLDMDLTSWVRIEIHPKPTPRPRFTKTGRVYNDPKYTRYLKDLTVLIKVRRLQKKDYYKLDAIFFLPYPKGTAKIRSIDNVPHRKKPDKDNYEKGLMDALEYAEVLANDGQISDGEILKRYTTEKRGFILFNLN